MNISDLMWKSSYGLNPTQRTVGKCIKLGAGEVILPGDEHSNCLSSHKWSALKTQIQVILCVLRMLYLGI